MMATPLHILIVDDSADNATMLRVLLKQEGYTAAAGDYDWIGFDPRGIASELGGLPVTLTVTKSSHSEVVTIDALGRVVK